MVKRISNKDGERRVEEYNDYIDEMYPPSKIFGVVTKSSTILKNLHPDKWSDGLDIFLESDDGILLKTKMHKKLVRK